MIWFKRILFFIFLLLFLLAGTVAFVSWKYADDLKAYALDAVRSTIVTETLFDEDVVLSIWADFPLMAVEISDIRIQDSFRTDTVLKVEKAFVQFDIIKLLKNQITIEGIRVSNGFLRIKRNEQNEWNFHVWEVPETDDGQTKTDFSIEILTLENIHLDYDDRIIDLNIQYLSHRSKIKGRFTDSNQRLSLSLTGHMANLNTVGADRVVDIPMNLAGILNINSSENRYMIEMGNIVLAGNEMVLDAEWSRVEVGTNFMLKVHAGNIEPFALLPHIWPQIPENITKLQLKGRADLIFSLNGPFNQTQGPQLDATIRLRDGGLVFQETNVSDLKFEGKLFMKDIKRSKAMEITFDSFDLKTPKGKVSGKGTLTDLTNPRLRLTSAGSSRLEELIAVANLKDDITGSGDITWNIDFEGPLGKDFNTTVNELKQMRWSGAVQLANSSLQFNSGIPAIENLNAKVEMSLDKTVVKECSGTIGHLEFDGMVEVARLKEIMTESNAPIDLTGNVHIKRLDVQQIPVEWAFSSESETTSDRPVSMIIQTKIDQVDYSDFSASNVTGNLKLVNDRLDVTGLTFNALDGKISTNLTYEPNISGYLLSLNAELRNIDMQRTLKEWNEFGQNGITSKNLKGRASAILKADIHLDKDYQILKNKLEVESDIEISGGELVKYEPLLAMSKFISVDELNHVKFDTLRNNLSIKDGRIYIPHMSVSSSILNVHVYGEHGFDQEMDYHVNLLLNDLLRRKAKKKEMFDGHEILDEQGKTRLFLWIRGRPGDLKVGFDKKEVRKKLKDDFKKEGQTIKQLFKEEFGGKESAPEEPAAVQFRLEEPETETTISPTEKPKADEKPKKKRGLFSTEPEKEETEGGFEIEFDP